jgi:hypothetical protein
MSQRPRKFSLTPRISDEQPSLSGLAVPAQNGGQAKAFPFPSQPPAAMSQQQSAPFFAPGDATGYASNAYGPPSFQSAYRSDQAGLPDNDATWGLATQSLGPTTSPFAWPGGDQPREHSSAPFAFGQQQQQQWTGSEPGSGQPGGQGASPFASSARATQQPGNSASSGSTGFSSPLNATGTPTRAFSTGAFSTGALALTNGADGQGKTGTMKLAQSVKVVQVPVAGQPGRYVTGFLPVLPQTDDAASGGASRNKQKDALVLKVRVISLIVAVVLILLGTSIYLFQPFGSSTTQLFNPGAMESAATATAQANTILSDPLSQPIHNWPIVTNGSPQYIFENGAYHVIVSDNNNLALPLLPGENFTNMAYTVTWQEVQGDDKAAFDWFGVVLRYSDNNAQTFYAFVYMPSTGEYQFREFNSNQDNPWTIVWHHGKGSEYHTGHNAKNTVKVVASGSNFTFIVNGKQVGTAQNKDLTSGQIGMIVNLNGFEVAYSNLAVTYK